VATEFGGVDASTRPHLEVSDVAAHVRHILELPRHVQVHDILVRPTRQLV
jgi:NADP-dependent 3-hydroxy acid dehydrogenase YdfG